MIMSWLIVMIDFLMCFGVFLVRYIGIVVDVVLIVNFSMKWKMYIMNMFGENVVFRVFSKKMIVSIVMLWCCFY